MKHPYLIPAGLLALLISLAFTPVYADSSSSKGHQQDMMHGKHSMGHYSASWKKSLTKKQRARLDQLKLNYIKKKYPLKPKKKALKIDLALLATADKPDMKTIDKKIDELLAIKKQMMALKYNYKVAVRKELTPEQRVQFDIAMLKKAKKGKKRRYHH